MLSLARWCSDHRRLVVVLWVIALVGVFGGWRVVGSRYANNFSLGNTGSQHATDLLQKSFPTQSGDRDQIVFHAPAGIAAPEIRGRIAQMLGRVSGLPHVAQVLSPYARTGSGQISRDGKTAFAIVLFDEKANLLPTSAIKDIVSTAEAARSEGLQVELGGQAIEQVEVQAPGSLTGIGVLAAAVVLLVSFGSFLAMGLPIVTALFGLGTGIGLIGLASHVLDQANFSIELAALIGLGVGIDYALFILNRYREAYRENGGGGARRGAARDGQFLGRRRRRGPKRGFWVRWVGVIQRHPVPAAIAATALMLTLAAPALWLRLGSSDAGNDPTSFTSRRAYDLLAQGFGPGFNGPLSVVVQLPSADDGAAVDAFRRALAAAPGVVAVAPPRLNPSGEVAVLSAYPSSSPQSAATANLVKSLRSDVIPPLERRTGAIAYVGGATATFIDFSSVLSSKLWLFIAVVVLLSAILLAVVFRSLLIPVQAAVMNLLSIAASLGVIVAVFQFGWFPGVTSGPIEAFLPVLMFAIVFGLSMDYEVFLVSRIHEEWTRQGNSDAAIRDGLVETGRVRTWAFPARLDRRLPRFAIEHDSAPPHPTAEPAFEEAP